MLHVLGKRLAGSYKASLIHLILSLFTAGLVAAFIFGLWFPWPYRDMAGGTEIFILIITVDIVCGPLLTLVVFNKLKPKSELRRDLSLIAIVQLAALVFGISTLWEIRPLYLPHEIDRFKVVNLNDLRGATTDALPETLRPNFFKGPVPVSLRPIEDVNEKNNVLFEALNGGADYGDRPKYYLEFNEANAIKTLGNAKSLKKFLDRYPGNTKNASIIMDANNISLEEAKYLPIRARKDWIALLNKKGQIIGYLPGDGF